MRRSSTSGQSPARAPDDREWAADRVVHLAGLALGLPAALAIVAVTVARGAPAREIAAAVLYAGGVVAMFSCSAAYNLRRHSPNRDRLRRNDHAAIFAMIAGTYTPFTVRLAARWSEGLTAVIWAVAAAGIAAKLWLPHRIAPVSTLLYLALGWIGLVAAGPFIAAFARPTLLLLAAGGLIYSGGVVFHVWQRLRYQNAIWHGFVLAAACVHYLAVLSLAGA